MTKKWIRLIYGLRILQKRDSLVKYEDGIILKYDASGRFVGVEILFLSKQKKLLDEIKDRVGKIVEDFVSTVKAIA